MFWCLYILEYVLGSLCITFGVCFGVYVIECVLGVCIVLVNVCIGVCVDVCEY